MLLLFLSLLLFFCEKVGFDHNRATIIIQPLLSIILFYTFVYFQVDEQFFPTYDTINFPRLNHFRSWHNRRDTLCRFARKIA